MDALAGELREIRWRALSDGAPYAIFVVREHRVVYANPAALRLIGAADAASLIGRSIAEIFRRDADGSGAEGIARTLDPAGMPAPVVDTLLRLDGSRFEAEITATAHGEDSDSSFAVYARDVTAHRRGTDRFRQVVEAAPSAMVVVDDAGRMVLVNALAERMFGRSRSEMLGESIGMLVPERFRRAHAGSERGFFASPRSRPMGGGRDLFAVRADGTEFPAEIGLNPISTGDGVMVLAAIVDITERKHAEQALRLALQEKTVLLDEVHHRVKNNLQIVSSLLELQAMHAGDGRSREVLGDSQARVRAMALVHQLVYERDAFSRIDLRWYLERLVALLGDSFGARGGEVTLRLSVPESAMFLDPNRVIPCALFVNELVSNSFKHAFPDGRRGEIRVELRAVSGGSAMLAVGDDGVGIDVRIGADSGSLGLQLLPLFVEQLHGTLRRSAGPGTRFELHFPTNENNGRQ